MPRAAKKKVEEAQQNEGVIREPGPGGTIYVTPKTPFDWEGAMRKIRAQHWKRLVVTIKMRSRLMAGKPASLDAAKAMLKARGLEDAIEAVDTSNPEELREAAEQVQDEGLCEFHRRPGKSGIWFPTNNIKAGIKENWSVLTYRVAQRGSRGALAEAMFVYSGLAHPEDVSPEERDWIYLGEEPDGVETMVAHTMSPKGPVSSIKRHEYVEKVEIRFEIAMARAVAEKVPDEAMADTLIHFAEHGLGACRSQGFGRFDVLSVEDVTPKKND